MAGFGRLARPTYRYSGSVTFGLDDNVFSAPFNGQTVPAVTQEVIVTPEVPARTVTVTVNPPGRQSFFGPRPRQVQVVIAGQKAVKETVVLVPEQKPQDRLVSFVARTNVGAEVQFASRRSVFTMDLNGSASYYTNRPGDPIDLNGSLAFSYLYKLTPRAQFSASANLAYLSQPDPARTNSPNANAGDYFNGSIKADLTYRWTRRFSTVTSISQDATLYASNTQISNNYYATTVGTEARYLLFPRLTSIGEVRYSTSTHDSAPDLDSHSVFLLLGAEFPITKHLGASLRFGTQTRIFDASGKSSTGPFGEASVNWRYHPAGSLSWNMRYGFEEPNSPTANIEVFRTSVNIGQAFSARLRATGGLAFSYSTSSDDLTNVTTTSTNFSLDAGMEYVLTPNVTLTGTYSFLTSLSSVPATDYIRNQIFFGFRYSF